MRCFSRIHDLVFYGLALYTKKSYHDETTYVACFMLGALHGLNLFMMIIALIAATTNIQVGELMTPLFTIMTYLIPIALVYFITINKGDPKRRIQWVERSPERIVVYKKYGVSYIVFTFVTISFLGLLYIGLAQGQ